LANSVANPYCTFLSYSLSARYWKGQYYMYRFEFLHHKVSLHLHWHYSFQTVSLVGHHWLLNLWNRRTTFLVLCCHHNGVDLLSYYGTVVTRYSNCVCASLFLG